MLKQFHFIDQNGKDQGINVRNRSKELAELLSDVDRIRQERKKARTNRNKFGGVEGGAMSGGLSGGSRYGGFGSEDAGGYGGYSGGVYGDGGGFGGNTSGFQDSSSRRDRFEEYDEYDEGAVAAPGRRKAETSSAARREPRKAEPPKKKEPEVDILDFDDDIPPETPPKEVVSNGKKVAPNPLDEGLGGADDDDFDDFQSATPTTQTSSKPSIPGIAPPTHINAIQFAAPKPVSASQGTNLNDLVGFNSISPTPRTNTMISPQPSGFIAPPSSTVTSPPTSAFASPAPIAQQQPPRPTGYQASSPNYFTSVPVSQAASQPSSTGVKSPTASNPSYNKPAQAKSSSSAAAAGGDAFGSLWSTASATAGIKKTATPGGTGGPKLADLAKQKTSAGIWGANAPATTSTQPSTQPSMGQQAHGGQSLGGGLDDLL